MSRPTELAITLACLSPREDTWSAADEVRGRLVLLGFECTAQQVASWLKRMAETDAPWVERRRDHFDHGYEYRVTRFGRNDIDNRFPAVRPTHQPPIDPGGETSTLGRVSMVGCRNAAHMRDLQAAEHMAAAIDFMVHRGTMNARSPAGDARLNYGDGEPHTEEEAIRRLGRFDPTFG